jgi:hypothetical protein
MSFFEDKIITKIIIALPGEYNKNLNICIKNSETILMTKTNFINNYHIYEKSCHIQLNHFAIDVNSDIPYTTRFNIAWYMNEYDINHDDVKFLCGDSIALPNENEKRFSLLSVTKEGEHCAISVFVAPMGG